MKRLLTLLSTLVCAAALSARAVNVGEAAPEFELTGSDGKTYRLADFRGKKAVVLAWFPKAFTGGCTAECTSLRENHAVLKTMEAAVFAVSVDSAETNKKFAESLGLNYPILSDPTKATAKAYGVLNPGNGLASRWTIYIGKDGKVAHIDQSVQAGSHGKAVAEQLQKMGAGR